MYIINLSRFVSINEKKEIMNEIKKQGIDVKADSWSSMRLITDKPIFNKPYVSNVIELKETFYPQTLSATVEHLQKYQVKDINAKIWDNVPFHRKAIVDRFKKKNKFVDSGKIIYLEAKPSQNRKEPEVRLGIILDSRGKAIEGTNQRAPQAQQPRNNNNKPFQNQNSNQNNNNRNNQRRIEEPEPRRFTPGASSIYPDLLIESPKTIGEISDFVRLSKTFKLKIFISTLNDPDCARAIAEFKKSNTFDKADIEIIQFSDDLKKDYTLVGFSLWGRQTVSDLSSLSKSKKQLFLFGNEKRGLKKSTMDMCDLVIKIGEGSSEPLRATQAASFALGYLFKK